MNFFDSLPLKPLDPIFKLLAQYNKDKNKDKVNLGIGIYSDWEGNPYVFPTIKKAFEMVDKDNFNYQPIGGNRDFLELTSKLIFGKTEGIAMQASCGGTQACSIFAKLSLLTDLQRKIYIATPSWGNYKALFKDLEICNFKHLNDKEEINVQGYLEAAKSAQKGDIFLVQGGLSHNPTGRNLSLESLNHLIEIANQKSLCIFMDMAYLGLGEGFNRDIEYPKLCMEKAQNFALALSYSKNASLYEHRTGALFIKGKEISSIESQMKQIVRESVSMAPGIGQEIIINLLKNMKDEWLNELDQMRLNIDSRKEKLVQAMGQEFSYLIECKGMFGFLRLSPEQISKLREEKSIYMLENGRINFSGLRKDDISYFADSVKAIL